MFVLGVCASVPKGQDHLGNFGRNGVSNREKNLT